MTPRPLRSVGRWYEDFDQTTDDDVRELLARARRPPLRRKPEVVLALTGAAGDYDPLLERARGARFDLLGEASHGTHELYRERAEITKRLGRRGRAQARPARAARKLGGAAARAGLTRLRHRHRRAPGPRPAARDRRRLPARDRAPLALLPCPIADQFDAVVHIDETQAVEPLERTSEWETGELPETYPWGV